MCFWELCYVFSAVFRERAREENERTHSSAYAEHFLFINSMLLWVCYYLHSVCLIIHFIFVFFLSFSLSLSRSLLPLFLLLFRIYFEVVRFVKFIWFKCVLLKISPLTLSLCRSRLTIYCHFCICLCVDICIYMCTATHWAYDEKRIYLQMFLVSYAHARQQQQKKRDRNETTEQNVWYTANGMRSQSSKSVHWLGEWEREGKS